MKLSCPHCGQLYEVEPDVIGKFARCEVCGEKFLLKEVEAVLSATNELSSPCSAASGASEWPTPKKEQYIPPKPAGSQKDKVSQWRPPMPPEKVCCPHCNHQQEVHPDDLKKRITCTQCKTLFTPQPETKVRCPYCMGEISNYAFKCQHCGEWVKSYKGARKFQSPEVATVFNVLGVIDAIVAVMLIVSSFDKGTAQNFLPGVLVAVSSSLWFGFASLLHHVCKIGFEVENLSAPKQRG